MPLLCIYFYANLYYGLPFFFLERHSNKNIALLHIEGTTNQANYSQQALHIGANLSRLWVKSGFWLVEYADFVLLNAPRWLNAAII